jgi:hypothetical protein
LNANFVTEQFLFFPNFFNQINHKVWKLNLGKFEVGKNVILTDNYFGFWYLGCVFFDTLDLDGIFRLKEQEIDKRSRKRKINF